MFHKNLESIVKDLDEKGRVVVAANALGNEDSDGDISMPGSFKKTLEENFSRVKWFKDHDRTVLIGVPIKGAEDGVYLKMEGQLNLKKEVGRDVYEDYKLFAEHGKTLEHSIGVNAIKRNDSDMRQVLEWRLWEYSTLSSWGANSNTPMLGMKKMENAQDAIDWLNLCLRKGNYTDERCLQIESVLKNLSSLLTEPETTEPPLTQQPEPKSTTPDEPDEDKETAILLSLQFLKLKIS